MVFRLQWRGSACAVATLFALGLLLPSGASALPDAHGHLLHVVKPGLRANATESSKLVRIQPGNPGAGRQAVPLDLGRLDGAEGQTAQEGGSGGVLDLDRDRRRL